MTLQAYIDDSYDDDSGVYVLAGFIADDTEWGKFAIEWEKMLPQWGVFDSKKNNYIFKYRLMNTKERMEKIPVFLSTVEKYILGYITAKINTHDLKKAQKRIVVPGKSLDWGEWDSFFFTFRALMDRFHLERDKMLEIFKNEKIDFYFDEASQSKRVKKMWANYLNNREPKVRKYYGAEPKFVDDELSLPVQAADLLAGWTKSMYIENTPNKIVNLALDGFKAANIKKLMRIEITYNEEQIVEELIKQVRSSIGNELLIFDSGPKLIY